MRLNHTPLQSLSKVRFHSADIGLMGLPRLLGERGAGPILFAHGRDRPEEPDATMPGSCAWIRWSACAGSPSSGQAAAVAGVRFGLGFPLPFALCFLVIAASVWVEPAPAHPVSGEPPAQRQRRHRAPRLRHPAARGAALPDRRARKPLRHAVSRARADLGDGAHAGADARRSGSSRSGCATFLVLAHRPLPWFPGQSSRRFPSST